MGRSTATCVPTALDLEFPSYCPDWPCGPNSKGRHPRERWRRLRVRLAGGLQLRDKVKLGEGPASQRVCSSLLSQAQEVFWAAPESNPSRRAPPAVGEEEAPLASCRTGGLKVAVPQGPESQCGAKYTDFDVGPAASQTAHNAKPSGSSLLLAFHGATRTTLRDLGSGLSSPTEPHLALPTAQCPLLCVVFCLQVLPQGWLSDSQEKAQTEQ